MSEAKKDESDLSALLCAEPKKEDQTVVRVVTTSWMDSKGLHTKRSLNVLKRKSFGQNYLQEECSAVGAEDAAGNIINLQEVKDGIYEVVVCNASRDFETGYVDDWELKLVPFDA
jgi:hypothetical protein